MYKNVYTVMEGKGIIHLIATINMFPVLHGITYVLNGKRNIWFIFQKYKWGLNRHSNIYIYMSWTNFWKIWNGINYFFPKNHCVFFSAKRNFQIVSRNSVIKTWQLNHPRNQASTQGQNQHFPEMTQGATNVSIHIQICHNFFWNKVMPQRQNLYFRACHQSWTIHHSFKGQSQVQIHH